MQRGNLLGPFGVLVSAAAAFAPVAMATVAHADQPTQADAGHSDHAEESTKLGVCAPNLGGVKIPARSLVGYLGDVETGNGAFNKVNHREVELGFRLINLDDNCVESQSSLVATTVRQVACEDPSVVLNPSIPALESLNFREKQRRFTAEFSLPKGKRCYSITTAAPGATEIVALFRSK
ncbi:MAG: hypothetical protein F2681_01430 [Actinobacteria bacterium]|uniref:Unannotated protein n=1 Tax=freshwater metagenome TaxID=449393 RepID=A0A6J7AQH4_9ZZZZ|nr:hypothetical protein [Actinomycetota bacterium]MSW76077.1 hypothetical protein [Actinomycetota bacterium]MSX94417.1 hypothetical protein [Actinomycetota bacterium]MSZ81787.1 hypothetical protein [Actinomycetota bacterium]MTB16626.1 hypothetical protein [Actinomycetota bacterium]